METIISQPLLSPKFTTFIELLQWRAIHQKAKLAYTFLVDGETQETNLTYGTLDHRVRAIATCLQKLAAKGERALLLYPPGLDYITAFFGCLYAGIVAVPVYPPQPARVERNLPRLQAIRGDSQATVALTNEGLLASIDVLFKQAPEFRKLHWISTEDLPASLASEWHDPGINEGDLAFLQYTSGSTGQPKGVMVTHSNLFANHSMIQNAYQHPVDAPFVSWLPIFHDMGLIGGILQSMYCGAPCIFMSPRAFIQKPFRWLQALSRYQGHTSHAPNFAYDLCVSKTTPEQRATLDLSHWKVATNGSEPVRKETIQRFSEAFAPAGFRPEAFCPAYGLAEATLCVTVNRKNAHPIIRSFSTEDLERGQIKLELSADGQQSALVGCGQVCPSEHIVIVNPETCVVCPPNQIGEIWAAGPHIARGYWSHPKETQATFQAYLSEGDEGPFMRTGDLGFFYEDELYITGRLKDLIIIRGRNLYPQDIEATVGHCHHALRPDGGAAFSLQRNGEEQFVVVQEIERQHRQSDLENIFKTIHQAIGEQHEVQPSAIILIKPGTLPKTSSGKVQRHQTRVQYLAGNLEIIGEQHG